MLYFTVGIVKCHKVGRTLTGAARCRECVGARLARLGLRRHAVPRLLRRRVPKPPPPTCTGTGARPCHICTGTGARPAHICTGTGARPCHISTKTGALPAHICTGTGHRPHLHRNFRLCECVCLCVCLVGGGQLAAGGAVGCGCVRDGSDQRRGGHRWHHQQGRRRAGQQATAAQHNWSRVLKH